MPGGNKKVTHRLTELLFLENIHGTGFCPHEILRFS